MEKCGYYRDTECKNCRESFQNRDQNYKQILSDEEKLHSVDWTTKCPRLWYQQQREPIGGT